MVTSKRVLVVDSDPEALDLVRRYLSVRGYEVHTAEGGEAGQAAFMRYQPDLVILDGRVPDTEGRSLCLWLRERSPVPILVMAAQEGAPGPVELLNWGADQYMTKPVALMELEARARALLRRVALSEAHHLSSALSSARPDYDDGHLVIDLDRRLVTLEGQPVSLTATEFKILACLVKQAGSVVPHEELLSQVWGEEYVDDLAFLKTYIHHLRRKLTSPVEGDGAYSYILNKWGVGYRLRAEYERREAPGDDGQSDGWAGRPIAPVDASLR
jgi:two-component system KDP operon response regulator KdpE